MDEGQALKPIYIALRSASLETHDFRYLGTSNLGYGTKIENRCIFASHESNTDKY